MTKTIDVDTLRAWLEAQQPVTVVDVRSGEDRAQWAIPGSLHIDASEALGSNEPGPLASVDLPADRPVVTVCNAGRSSRTAADVLAGRGFEARSLAGGMKAWSLAWNVADIPLASSAAGAVVQVRRTGKGCLSYLVGSAGEAAVIDPSLAADVYVDLARRRDWTIRYVLDTHIHADHLSRARDLADRTGAALLLPAQERATFAFSALADGERVRIGKLTLEARHTPGHTGESTSYLLDEIAVFTGDTLFTDGVGRPDLDADADAARERARALFRSLSWLRQLPADTIVLPGHASEPIAFDGRPLAARMRDVSNWLSGWLASEPAFVERVTSGLPPTPANFLRIIELNEAGQPPPGDPAELEAGANRCAVK